MRKLILSIALSVAAASAAAQSFPSQPVNIVVTFPPERVVAAMAPMDGAPPTQPKQGGEPQQKERPSILKQPLFRVGT